MAADNRKRALAPDTAAWHRTAPTEKTQQHTEAALATVGLWTATQGDWLKDWLHSGGRTIKDREGMGQGQETERNAAKKSEKSQFSKVKIMNLLPLNLCLIQHTNGSVRPWMRPWEKACVIYGEDIDLSIEILPLYVSLVKAWGWVKRRAQWEVKRLFLFSPFYGSLFSRLFDLTVHWVTMAPKPP